MPAQTRGGGAHQFPVTRWTLILSARSEPQARRAALDQLLAAYWQPLYAFARRKGLSPHDAEDAVQGFVAQLLDRDFLAKLDPGKGRLRSYLRASLSNYLVNEQLRASTQKRGGAARIVDLDTKILDRLADDASTTPEAAYDYEWAMQIMQRALDALRQEFETGTRRGPFDLVLQFFGPGSMPGYASVAAEHGMTVPQLKSFLHRARQRFRELVRLQVAETVSEAADVDGEVSELLRALSA